MLTGAARLARPLVYVPNSESDTVDVIDPRTYRVVEHFAVGALPQHVVPAWDLRTLYVTNDTGNSLTPIDPRTGEARRARSRSTTRTTCTSRPTAATRSSSPSACTGSTSATRTRFRLHRSLAVPCAGVDHMDFSADGRYLLASCEFSGQMVEVDVAARARRPDASTCPTAPRHAAGRQALARRQRSSTSPTCTRTASGRSTAHSLRVARLPADRRRRARPLPEPRREAASTSRTAARARSR